MPGSAEAASPAVTTGAARLAAAGFAMLAGKRVGLITNQTGRVGDQHLADLMSLAHGVRLAAILAPEHGFRGQAEAGASIEDGRDRRLGVPVLSLYGATRKPTAAMLRGLDVLVFDIQDVGARFYTYISTMGLAMQAAAAAGLPFLVLDRPNPLGGEDVAGFVLEPALRSFVGQYPIPMVHGLSVGELARMIKAEAWLDGLADLELSVLAMSGWQRAMRWPATGLPWVPTSPNIPTFEAALAYPGMGLVGEALVNEGRGTERPFTQFGAPWLDAEAVAADLAGLGLPGIRFLPGSYVPHPIPGVASKPRFAGQRIPAVRLEIADVAAYRPLEVGIHVLARLARECRRQGRPLLGKTGMFHKISGTTRLHSLLEEGASGGEIIGSWAGEVAAFRALGAPHLLY